MGKANHKDKYDIGSSYQREAQTSIEKKLEKIKEKNTRSEKTHVDFRLAKEDVFYVDSPTFRDHLSYQLLKQTPDDNWGEIGLLKNKNKNKDITVDELNELLKSKPMRYLQRMFCFHSWIWWKVSWGDYFSRDRKVCRKCGERKVNYHGWKRDSLGYRLIEEEYENKDE